MVGREALGDCFASCAGGGIRDGGNRRGVVPGPFAERIICGPAYAYLQDHGDHVLTDSIGALLLTGKPVLVSNPFVYSQMVIQAGWPHRVLQKIQEKEFDVILLREQLGVYHPDDRFTGETVRAIRKNYHEGAAFECYDSGFAYLPKPLSFLGKTEREPKKLA